MYFELIAWTSIFLGFFTATVIIIDVVSYPQSMPIMNIVWSITGLYFPLIGLWFYYDMGKPLSQHGKISMKKNPFWKDVFVSSTHCGSGCVIGNIIGAPIIFLFGFTWLGECLFADYLFEFILAYFFGIAFQYIPIRAMQKISPLKAIMNAIVADTLSLIAFEIGMFGWMAIVHFLLMKENPPEINTIFFWFMMQIGMIFGFITTYPANWLLIKWGIKARMLI